MKQTSLLSTAATESYSQAHLNPQPVRTVLCAMRFILNRRKTILLALLMCLCTSFQLKAQDILNVSWTSGYPAFSNSHIGILSEDDSLKLRFTIATNNSLGEASKTRLVRLVLPSGVTVVSAADGGNASGSITTGTVKQSGTTWDIPISSISYNQEVNLVVMLRAGTCSSPTGWSNTTMSILSNEMVLEGGSRNINLEVVKPIITASPQNPNPMLLNLNEPFTYNIPLSVSNNVSAQSMRITITKDQFTTLSEFKLGSKTVTPASSSTATTVVLDLTEYIVGTTTPISAANPQTLQFTAQAGVGGSRSISATYIYPESGTACESNKSLFSLTLTYPSVPGIAVVREYASAWVDNHPSTNAVIQKAFDGLTTNWIRQQITNTGNAPIGRFTITTRTEKFNCINDTATIYYKIGNSLVKAVNRPYTYTNPLPSYYSDHTSFDMLTKPAMIGEPQRVTYTVEEEVPANTTVYLWIPLLVGTYDNTPWGIPPDGINETYCLNYINQRLLRYVHGATTAYDLNGNPVSVVGSLEGGYEWTPTFVAPLGKEQIKPLEDKWVKIPIYFNSVSPASNYSSTLHIQLPKWMELYDDGVNLSNSIKRGDNNNNFATGNTVSHNPVTNTYSLTVQTAFNGDVSFRYKGKENTFGYKENQTDTIRYWIDWDTGYGLQEGSPARIARPLIEYHAKNIQQVEYLAKSDGITLTSLAFERISRGLKVSSFDNRTPDTGSLADFSVIDNEMYLQGDTGRIVVEGQTGDSSYEYLYVLINSTYRPYFRFAGLNQTNPYTRATVYYVDNGAYTIGDATIVEGGENCYLKFRNTGKFPANTNVRITVPFVAGNNDATRDKSPVKVEVYLSDVDIANPLNPQSTDRHGMEFLSGRFGTHNKNGGKEGYSSGSASISSGTTSIELGTIRTFANNAGYAYPNEYRPYMHPTTMTIKVPAGYTAGNFRIARHSSYIDASSSIKTEHSIPPKSSTVNSDGSITYIYNTDSIYDFTANTYDKAQAAGNAGYWIAPDDAIYYPIYMNLTPSPLAPSLGTVESTFRYTILPDYTTETMQYIGTPVSYNGARGELTIPTSTITGYDYSVSVPSVIASIVSSANAGTRKAWLYVEGNIRDVSLQTAASGTLSATPISGNKGYWIALGDITMGAPVSYQLNYTHNSLKAAGDSVRVYLVADFNNTDWSPTTTAPVNVNDTEHLGGSKWIVTKASTNSVIQGSITVPDTKIAYDDPYDVTLSVDGKAGYADLINPEITLTVPDGQTPKTFQYEYPAGSGWKTILEEAISYPSGNQITLKSSYFDGDGNSNFVLYGSGMNTSNANRTLNVRISFSAGCNTILNGFSYTASFAGKNLINNAVSGINGFSKTISTNVNSLYYFSTVLNFVSGLSFGGDCKENVLQVTVNKWVGELDDIFDTDSLIIMLPQWLNVNGAVTTTSELIPGLDSQPVASADIVNEERSEYRRRISIKLPATVLNTDTGGLRAKGKDFTYHIPLVYTEDAQDEFLREHPIQTVRTDVYTVVQFAPADACAEGSSFSLGYASTDVALLTIKSDNPYIYNMASLGRPFRIEVTSDLFTGGWYTDENLSTVVLGSSGGIYSHTRSTPDTARVFVKSSFNNAFDFGKIPVTLRTPPLNLAWRTTATNEDWLNPANWTTNLGDVEDEKGYLPALITEVTLPSEANKYPVLSDSVACHVIRFEHGAELGRQDLLVYDSARVQLNITANQWYMFSPPLHQMYSGDFYREHPDPYYDEQTAYTVQFNITNPETDKTPTGSWNGAFNTPNVLLDAGSGLAIWIDDGKEAGTHAALSFEFPKHDTEHHLYNPNRFPPGNISKTYAIDRDKNGRFIYEKTDQSGNVTLPVSSSNGSVLIGNPFMAHLDFSKFYESNEQALNNSRGYKLVHGSTNIDNFYSYQWTGSKYVSTSPSGESNGLIAPMQSFIVEVKDATSLQANIYSHTATSVEQEDAFRDAEADASQSSRQLNILAVRNTEVSKAIVLQGASYATNYVPSEDSYKLFVSKVYDSDDALKHVQVYTRSSDGYALDINFIGMSAEDITIPLGIRTSEKGEIVLNFSGMESFGESTGIYLYDAQHPERLIDLKTQPEYAFEKTEDELYLENRFSLVISNSLTQQLGMEMVSESSAVRILSLSPHTLRIVSASGEALSNVRITDTWGRIVLDNPAVSASVYEYQTPTPGVYIVRIGAEVKKVVSIR